MRTLQVKMTSARQAEGLNRQELASLATSLGVGVIQEREVRRMENELLTPPADGVRFMAVCTALKIDIFEVLTELGYWPPPIPSKLRRAFGKVMLQKVADLCNWTMTPAGDKIVIHIS